MENKWKKMGKKSDSMPPVPPASLGASRDLRISVRVLKVCGYLATLEKSQVKASILDSSETVDLDDYGYHFPFCLTV